MKTHTTTAPNGVYRTPGRVADVAPFAAPSWRTMFAPLGFTLGSVVLGVAVVAVWNAVFGAAPSESGVRFVPAIELAQDGLAFGLLASLVALVVLIVRRVRPSWGGLRVRSKVLYVAAMLAVQSVAVVAGEVAMLESRGGLRLFEPSWKGSMPSWDGRTAHLYKEGFGCGYEVYVSDPFQLTMKRTLSVSRKSCDDPAPAMKWNADGSVGLYGKDGQPLESEYVPPFSFGFGC